jgi:hypothetical protein
MVPTVSDAMAAKFLRQDPAPAGERPVKVRIKLCSENFPTPAGLVSCGDSPVAAPDSAVAYGTAEIDMYPSHAAKLEAEWSAKQPTPTEIERAFFDLEGDLVDVGALPARADHTRAPSRAAIIGALRRVMSGEVVGTTRKHYRPSWSASFLNANRREWPAIESVEIVPEEKPTTPKR